jgi:5'-nucleotidase/UDP-sugar diphosphatase
MIDPWQVKVVNGRKIGFVGSVIGTLSSLSSPGPDIYVNGGNVSSTVENMLRSALVSLMDAHPDCNIIILLTTGSPSEASSIARTVNNIDIIIHGNQALLHNGVHTYTPAINSGGYPQVITNIFGRRVLTVSASELGTFVGDLQVTFDDSGIITNIDDASNTYELLSTIASDPTILSSIQSRQPSIDTTLKAVVGSTKNDISGDRGNSNTTFGCRFSDCPMGHVITDALYAYCTDCHLAVYNGGGIRDSFVVSRRGGNITRADVISVVPFQNTMATATVKGSVLLSLLAFDATQRGAGGWLQMSGCRIAWNPSTNALIAAQLQDRVNGDWHEIIPTNYYKVASGSFWISGGDGYGAIMNGQLLNVNSLLPLIEETIFSYLSKNPVLTVDSTSMLQSCASTQFVLTHKESIILPSIALAFA